MKQFKSLVVLLFLLSFAITSCKGDKKTKEAGETSAEQKIEGKTESEDVLLTEKEVKAFLEAFPIFIKFVNQKEQEVERLPDSKNVLRAMKTGHTFMKYKEELDKALKAYGFTIESFVLTQAKVMGTFAYMQLDEARKASKENMQEMLNNPNIPEAQKNEIKNELKELEESEETKEIADYKENCKIVTKYQDEIESLFE